MAARLPRHRRRGCALGDADFSGKLVAHLWPESFDQIFINVDKQGDKPGLDAAEADPLFPHGFGLAY
jgi:hypothetical protein